MSAAHNCLMLSCSRMLSSEHRNILKHAPSMTQHDAHPCKALLQHSVYVGAFTRWLVPLPPWNQSLLVRYLIRPACTTCKPIAALASRTKPAGVQAMMLGLCLFNCLEGGAQQAARARIVACRSSTLTCMAQDIDTARAPQTARARQT